MAKISIIEREYIERILEMQGGYVLDFSNNKFQELLYQVIGIDVYAQYEYESKAKLLRRVFNDIEDKLAGKILMELLRYKKEHLKVKEEEKKDFNKALEITFKLLGRKPKQKKEIVVEKFDFDGAKIRFRKSLEYCRPSKKRI